mgnify:CR=1 FL=1
MSYTIETKYFNSFWLKKVVKSTDDDSDPLWPGLPWNPTFDGTSYPTFPFAGGVSKIGWQNFYIEEATHKGGFNNTSGTLGVRAFTVDETVSGQDRKHSLIYSGVLNSRTGFNQTNVFSISDPIVKDLDPINGSVQKLYTEDTNLTVLQENKVIKMLVNKNAMYDGDQGSQDTANIRFLGQPVAYLGEYGISKNPESFAFYGYRKYFADKNRAAILRLSRDGITEISAYGMRDYFRDYLQTISDLPQRMEVIRTITGGPSGAEFSFVTSGTDWDGVEVGAQVAIDSVLTTSQVVQVEDAGVNGCTVSIYPSYTFGGAETTASFITYRKGKVHGAYDIHQGAYTLSLQTEPRAISTADDTYDTLGFDENVKGWTSFYSYKPVAMGSMKNKFYTFIDSNIYEQYDEVTLNNRGNFYGAGIEPSSMTFIFNPTPSVTKNFNTVGYEGSSGWQVESMVSDFEGVDLLNGGWNEYQDSTTATPPGVSILSYLQGRYESATPVNSGLSAVTPPYSYAGFHRKENKYVSNIVNNSPTASARPGEVIFGNSMSGIKELFSVSSNYVLSSY